MDQPVSHMPLHGELVASRKDAKGNCQLHFEPQMNTDAHGYNCWPRAKAQRAQRKKKNGEHHAKGAV
jgi:hypothetical protein